MKRYELTIETNDNDNVYEYKVWDNNTLEVVYSDCCAYGPVGPQNRMHDHMVRHTHMLNSRLV